MLQLFLNLKNIISSKIRSFFSFFTISGIKLFLLAFIFTYTIALIIVLFFLFKHYKEAILHHNTHNFLQLNNDMLTLFNNYKTNGFQYPIINKIYPIYNIKQIYQIHGISHYTDYIYAINPDMQSLNLILMENPVVESKFKELILQDMIGSHVELFSDITNKFLRYSLKVSLPLVAACITIMGIYTFETLTSAGTLVLTAPILN